MKTTFLSTSTLNLTKHQYKNKSLTLQTPSTQIDRPLKFFLTISGLEHNVPSTTVLLNVAKNFEPIGLQLSSHSASSVINT